MPLRGRQHFQPRARGREKIKRDHDRGHHRLDDQTRREIDARGSQTDEERRFFRHGWGSDVTRRRARNQRLIRVRLASRQGCH